MILLFFFIWIYILYVCVCVCECWWWTAFMNASKIDFRVQYKQKKNIYIYQSNNTFIYLKSFHFIIFFNTKLTLWIFPITFFLHFCFASCGVYIDVWMCVLAVCFACNKCFGVCVYVWLQRIALVLSLLNMLSPPTLLALQA